MDGPRRTRSRRGAKERILRMAACTDYAFRLNEHMVGVLDDWKDRSAWDDNEPKIGIHLRRGDAATEDLEKLGFSLDTLNIKDISDKGGFLESLGQKYLPICIDLPRFHRGEDATQVPRKGLKSQIN